MSSPTLRILVVSRLAADARDLSPLRRAPSPFPLKPCQAQGGRRAGAALRVRTRI
jgi:hypothetical protein